MKLSIIIPCYNEKTNIRNLYLALEEISVKCANFAEFFYIFINDGSTDDTWAELQQLKSLNCDKIKLINLSRNFGKENALLAGIENATASDYYLTMDADLQDDPFIIDQMIQKVEQDYDIVYAKRLTREDSYVYKFFSKVFYFLVRQGVKFDLPDNVADFYMFSHRVRDVFLQMKESVRYTRGLIFYTGFNQAPVYYHRKQRQSGKSSFESKSLVKFALDAITSFSYTPLHFISIIAIILSISSIFVVGIYTILSFVLSLNQMSGWASIIIIISFFGSLQLLVLGVMAEYIARGNIELKNRPKYIIKDTI